MMSDAVVDGDVLLWNGECFVALFSICSAYYGMAMAQLIDETKA